MAAKLNGDIRIKFDEEANPSVSMSGNLPEGTRKYVQEVMGWLKDQQEEGGSVEGYGESGSIMENAETSEDPGNAMSREQMLKQDAGKAGHITLEEQVGDQDEDDLSTVLQRDEDGAPPIERQKAKPLTAGPHALYNNSDAGKHVNPDAGSTNPIMEDMEAVEEGRKPRDLPLAQKKMFEGKLSELRKDLDEALNEHDNEKMIEVHRRFRELKNRYNDALEAQQQQDAENYDQSLPTEPEHHPADQEPASFEELEEAREFEEDLLRGEEELDVDVNNIVGEKESGINEHPDFPNEQNIEQQPGAIPGIQPGEQPPADPGQGAMAPPEGGMEGGGDMTLDDLLAEAGAPEGGEEEEEVYKGFIPLFYGADYIDIVEKARLKGSAGGQALGGAKTGKAGGAKQTRRKGHKQAGHKYIRRWWENGKWNYEYAKDAHAERHGLGKNAVESMKDFKDHTIEVHPKFWDRLKGIKSQVGDAAQAYAKTVKAYAGGKTPYTKPEDADPSKLTWSSQDSSGKHHVFRQHYSKNNQVLHSGALDEAPADPHSFEFDPKKHKSSLAKYKSHNLVHGKPLGSAKDSGGQDWLSLKQIPSSDKRFDGHYFELSELADNQKGIGGLPFGNARKFKSQAAAERAMRFVAGFEKLHTATGGQADESKAARVFDNVPVDQEHLALFKDHPLASALITGRIPYYQQTVHDSTYDKEGNETPFVSHMITPKINDHAVRQFMNTATMRSIAKEAIKRAGAGFQMATGKNPNDIDPGWRENLMKSAPAAAMMALSMRHTPGSSGSFVAGFTPGEKSNPIGYIAHALANKRHYNGIFTNILLDMAGKEGQLDDTAIAPSKGVWGQSAEGYTPEELVSLKQQFENSYQKEVAKNKEASGGDIDWSTYSYEGDDPFGGGGDDSSFDSGSESSSGSSSFWGDDDVNWSKYDDKSYYKGLDAVKPDMMEDVPGAEIIDEEAAFERSLRISAEDEGKLRGLVKSLEADVEEGVIEEDVLKSSAVYQHARFVLNSRDNMRLIIKSVDDVSRSPVQKRFLGGLLMSMYTSSDMEKSIHSLIIENESEVSDVIGGDIPEARRTMMGWFEEVKDNRLFRSVLYLNLADEFSDIPEADELFKGFAREALVKYMLEEA